MKKTNACAIVATQDGCDAESTEDMLPSPAKVRVPFCYSKTGEVPERSNGAPC